VTTCRVEAPCVQRVQLRGVVKVVGRSATRWRQAVADTLPWAISSGFALVGCYCVCAGLNSLCYPSFGLKYFPEDHDRQRHFLWLCTVVWCTPHVFACIVRWQHSHSRIKPPVQQQPPHGAVHGWMAIAAPSLVGHLLVGQQSGLLLVVGGVPSLVLQQVPLMQVACALTLCGSAVINALPARWC
jgi:hypothetical protein